MLQLAELQSIMGTGAIWAGGLWWQCVTGRTHPGLSVTIYWRRSLESAGQDASPQLLSLDTYSIIYHAYRSSLRRGGGEFPWGCSVLGSLCLSTDWLRGGLCSPQRHRTWFSLTGKTSVKHQHKMLLVGVKSWINDWGGGGLLDPNYLWLPIFYVRAHVIDHLQWTEV